MLTQWKNSLKFILTRTIILYLACFFLVWRILDYHQLINNAIPQTMSRLTPPIDYFAEFIDRKDHFDRFKLMNCVNYHETVAHFFTYQKAEAYGMLGFCYERLGQQSQAVASFQQAIAFNPDYFWPYYNLGVIFYGRSQYPQAEAYFQQAIDRNPVKTIVLLSRSKVYNDVRLSQPGGTYDFLQGLKQGRTEAYILLMDSLYKNGLYVQLLNTALYGLQEGLDIHGIFYYYAGVAAFNQKSYQKAVDFLQMAIQDDPRNADALLYLGMCLHLANKEKLSQEMIRRAILLHQQEGSAIAPYLKARVRFF